MSKFTPAPWKYYRRSCPDPDELHRFFIAQPEGNNHIIANTVKEYASIDDEANAALIASAPDLLKALQDLESMCNMPEVKRAMMKHEQAYYHATMNAARVAIRKAEQS